MERLWEDRLVSVARGGGAATCRVVFSGVCREFTFWSCLRWYVELRLTRVSEFDLDTDCA